MKFLQNRLAVLSIVLVLLAIALTIMLGPCTSDTVSDDRNVTKTGPCDPAATPDYCRINDLILAVSAKPWDKYAYKRTSNTIAQTDALTKRQAATLSNQLISAYVGKLAEAIQQHIITAEKYDDGKVTEFRTELNGLPASSKISGPRDEQLRLLNQYASARSLPQRVIGYVTNNQYDAGTNTALGGEISNVKKDTILNKNQSIINSLGACKEKLDAFPKIDATFENIKNNNLIVRYWPGSGEVLPVALEKKIKIGQGVNRYYAEELKKLKAASAEVK